MTDKQGFMEMDTYEKIFESGVPKAIKLNWRGEPLLHQYLPYMVKYAKSRGVLEVLLNTNGLFLTKELATRLTEAGLDWIIISCDGATKSTYEDIRFGGDFDKLYKNIVFLSLMEKRPKIRIQMCKQPRNADEVDIWIKIFKPYADKLRIGKLFDPQGKRGYSDIKQPKSCTQLWQRIVVGWNGDIYPCCADYMGIARLGNIKTTSIKEAWHSKKLNALRYTLSKYGRKVSYLCQNCTSYC